MPKVVHVTSAHPLGDTRIFVKEALSLAEAGYDVTLIGPRGDGTRSSDRVRVIALRAPRSRLLRIFSFSFRVVIEARRLKAAIYHLHDPELLLFSPLLRRNGALIVFDAHEDLANQVLVKAWIPKFLRAPLQRILRNWFPRVTRRLDAVVAATPAIEGHLRGAHTVVVRNYPLLAELEAVPGSDYADRPPVFVYVGAVSQSRGASLMAKAAAMVRKDVELQLRIAGTIESELEDGLWSAKTDRVVLLGRLRRPEVRSLLSEARAGLSVLLPTLSYVESLPTKLFEYMAAGIPVIASDFPLWREIVETAECGLLVDPLQPQELAEAMEWILSNPNEARVMGERGKRAVARLYGWNLEEEKLLGLYEQLLCR